MKKINIRSPYFIVIDEAGQTTSKIEIYLWNKGNPTPTIPQYTLSKKAVSTMQTSMHYNVSNYAKEYIKPISPSLVTVPTEEDVNTWCYMQVIGYSDDVAVFDETFICLNGLRLPPDTGIFIHEFKARANAIAVNILSIMYIYFRLIPLKINKLSANLATKRRSNKHRR